ncbi:MAG: putative exported protein of unknown function [Hyphomicrobiales bacterium]|nr:putative exported protein of unknown function [Hyphomicrobiales bacterium]
MVRKTAAILASGAMLLVGGAPASARPLTPAEERSQPYKSVLPLCADPAVLSKIASRFLDREDEYWSSGLQIVAYEKVRESGFRSNGLDYIPRRYCQAGAVMNDGKVRRLAYSIGENAGIIGWSWGVEWCIVGLDRNLAHGSGCKAAGP